MERTTWVEISVAALEANFRAVADLAATKVCAVVKANAYGHGLAETARVFARAGAAMLAVTRIEEARELRDAGIDAPILLLTPPPDPSVAVRLDCALAVGSAEEIGRLPHEARVHLKVDTGMGRLGVSAPEAAEAARAVAARARLEAVWTHFADAAGPIGRDQSARFLQVREAIRAAGIEVSFHAANSAALLTLPQARLDMVRAGTLLYGQDPAGATAPFPLRETFTWFARVASIREIPTGATVGYGAEWRAQAPTRVATLPVGYADGFVLEPRARTETMRGAARLAAAVASVAAGRRPSPRAVMFGEARAPVVGRVAMQTVTVSLAGAPAVALGDAARIPARRLLVNPAIERVYA